MRGTTTTRPGPVQTRAAECTTPRARPNTHYKHWNKKMGPDTALKVLAEERARRADLAEVAVKALTAGRQHRRAVERRRTTAGPAPTPQPTVRPRRRWFRR